MFELSLKSDVEATEREPLLDLCRKEAENFSEFLKRNPKGPNDEWLYEDGLAKWEISAIASYLYQKTKGRL